MYKEEEKINLYDTIKDKLDCWNWNEEEIKKGFDKLSQSSRNIMEIMFNVLNNEEFENVLIEEISDYIEWLKR